MCSFQESYNPCTALMRTALPSLTYILTLLPPQQEPCSTSEWAGLLFQQNSFICKDSYSATLTDSGALMKTLDFPSWYWSGSMLTDWSRWRTPCFSSPFQEGHVALVRMAYLNHQGEEIKIWHRQTGTAEYHWLLALPQVEDWQFYWSYRSLDGGKMHSIKMFSRPKQLQWEGQHCPGISHFQMLRYYLVTGVVNYRMLWS